MTAHPRYGGTLRRTAVLVAALVIALAVLGLLVARAVDGLQSGPVSFQLASRLYQGNRHCVLVADIHSDWLAASGNNRHQLNLTEACMFCLRSWAVYGSHSYRMRVFVRPCLPSHLPSGPDDRI